MIRRGMVIVTLLALAGCATPTKTHIYSLSSATPPVLVASPTIDYRVAIGPVTVPEALDRPQIVLRAAPNRYAISDTARWSAPLKREIPRVVAEEVGQHLRSTRVAARQQLAGQDADYRVAIDVVRFESVPGVSITLEATWDVRNRDGVRLQETHSVFVEHVDSPGIAPLVAAHAQALAALGRTIAESIETLARAKR